MAWRELTQEDEVKQTPPESNQGFALPVPQDPEFTDLKKSLFEEVKAGIQGAEDPRFARLRFGPRDRQGGGGEGALPPEEPTQWRQLEDPPPAPKPKEEMGVWDRLVDWTSRSVIEQMAGGAREMGQRFAFESATETGKELQQVRDLEGQPEGQTGYFGPRSLGDMMRHPFKYMNPVDALAKMGLSATEEGRQVLEAKLLEEMQGKLDKAKKYAEGAEMRPFSKVTQQFLNPESENSAWEDFMADPVTIVAELGTRSLPNMAPGMALGVAGGTAAGLPGFSAGMGAGSARVEYAATIMDELQKQKIDVYNAEELMGVLGNSELMDEIHQKAVTRSKNIGGADAAAGALGGTVLVKKLGGPVITKLTEAIAQMGTQGTLGGLGEALAMEATGEADSLWEAAQTRDVLAEVAGEAVTAPIDVAAATISGVREQRAGKTVPIAETDIDPDTGKPVIRKEPEVEVTPDVQAETRAPAFETPEDGMSEAERAGIEAALDEQAQPEQSTLDLPPQEGQPAPPTPEPTQATPTPPAGETQTAPVEDQVITEEDLVNEPSLPDMNESTATPEDVAAITQREEDLAEPAPAPVEEAQPVESPMIDKKEVETGFRDLNKRTKKGMPGIRRAIRELGTAIQAVFPDAKLPSLKGTIGPKRIADFFATLDEQVVIDDVLPNLKEYLRAVLESPDAATAVQNFNSLKEYVQNSGVGVVSEGAKTPYLQQATKGITAYDTYEAERTSKKQKYKTVDKNKKSPTYGKVVERERLTGPKNRLANRAVAVDELATTVTSLTERATELGISVPAEVNETVRRARSYRESSQIAKPRTLKGGAGSTVTPQKFSAKNLNEVGGKLRAAAQTLVEQIAAAEAEAPKKPKVEAKVEAKKPVTEAPAKPKKAEAAKKTSKAKAEKKAAPEKPAAKKEQAPALKAYNELRQRAKELGVKSTGKKEELAARVAEAEQARGEVKVEKQVKVTKKGKPKKVETVKAAPDPEAVIEVAPVPTRGKQAGKVVEELGFEAGTSLAEALEESGIDKKSADRVRGLIAQADEEGQKKIIQAIRNYKGADDMVNFVATVNDALGGQVDNVAMMDVLKFVETMAERKAMTLDEQNRSASQEALAEEAAAQGMSVEDYKFILEETGQYNEEMEQAETPWSDEFHDMSVDEFENSQFMTSDSVPQGALDSMKDIVRAMMKKGGLIDFMYRFTKQRGKPDPGPMTVNGLLEAIITALPENNRYVPLARRLLQLDLDIPVYLYDDSPSLSDGRKVLGSYYPGNEFDPSTRRIRLYWGEDTDKRRVIATALHEIVHAATLAGYHSDPVFRSEIDALYDQAVEAMDQQEPNWRDMNVQKTAKYYGLTDQLEFIAEALTNPEFQQWLSQIPSGKEQRQTSVAGTMSGLMRSFINSIKKYLGYSIRNSVLEDVLILVDANLQTEEDVLISQQKLQVQHRRAKERLKAEDTVVSERNEVLDTQKELGTTLRSKIKQILGMTNDLAQRGNLGLSNLDVMERDFRALFDKAAATIKKANPLTAYTKAKNSASALARKYEKQAYQLLRKLQKVDNAVRSKMETIMRDVTLSNIDPTQPLNSAANAHIWTKGGKKTPPRISKKYADKAPKARQNWINFQKAHPEEAALLQEMAALTRKIHDTKVRSALFALGEMFELPSSMISALQAATEAADIDKIIHPDAVEVLEKKLEGADKKTKKAIEKLIAQAEAHAEVAKSAKKILHESSIKGWYFPLRRYGDFVVSTEPDVTGSDRYVSFHQTQEEANRIAAALNAKYPDNPVTVSLKLQKAASTADVKSVVGDLTRRFRGEGNKATRDRLRAAMAEVLAANAAYQSQLTRQNVDGVAASDMARGFEEYVHVSKFTIGDLLVSHRIADAINDLNDLQANATGVTDNERIQIGRVVNEIKKRNVSDANDRQISKFQRAVGLIGFFNYLGAPSYWALNATQTYTVTVPYITAKFGIKAPVVLANAQGTVLKAVAKALASNDKSYEGFKAQLPPEAQMIVEQLEADNIIQSTIAHEFGDMLSPNAMNKMRKHALGMPVARTAELAVQVMEKVPEAVEHFNRISTALAIYNLTKGNMQAVTDGVQATQFNYDTGNRARLLKELPGGHGGRLLITPVMMFKTYGIGIARLLYGAMIDVVRKEGGRAEAAKLAAGLITSHTLFGGVAGGLMMAPVMAIQAAANAVFSEAGDEWDLEDAVEEWAREISGDTFATMARRGIPAAVLGTDMSRSINLGNLLWMSDDRLDPTKYGELEQMIFRTVGGPIASYGANTWREGARLIDEGGRNWPEFLEAAIPLKAYRGVSQAVRYNTQGIETRGELEFVKPEEFKHMFQTLLGFQSSQKTTVQDEYYSEQARQMRRSDRRGQLMNWANEAIRDGDYDALAKVMNDIEKFNESIATRPEDRQYRVTPRDLAMLRSRRRTAQREYDKKFRYSD